MMVRVEQGKGRKDRYTILSQRLLCGTALVLEGASLADLFVSQSKGHSDLDRLRPENLQSGEALELALKKGTGFIRSGTVLLLIFWKPGWI